MPLAALTRVGPQAVVRCTLYSFLLILFYYLDQGYENL